MPFKIYSPLGIVTWSQGLLLLSALLVGGVVGKRDDRGGRLVPSVVASSRGLAEFVPSLAQGTATSRGLHQGELSRPEGQRGHLQLPLCVADGPMGVY